jgi:Putative restriction endonuclease
MPVTKTKPATYADIEALPPNVVGEILYGALVTQPRPARRHAAASSILGMTLGPPFSFGNGGPGGWIIIDEPELHLGQHVVVPDLAGWKRERLVGREEGAWFEEVPNWICEVLSPATEVYDRGEKRKIYVEHGVDFLWLLDPRIRNLEVFVRVEKSWLLINSFSGSAAVSAPPFDAISFSLGQLWPFDPPPADDSN